MIPSRWMEFRKDGQRVGLPLVRGRMFTNLCEALADDPTSQLGRPVYVQTEPGAIGCSRNATTLALFGHDDAQCRAEPAQRCDPYLNACGGDTPLTTWSELFGPDSRDSNTPLNLAPTYRTFALPSDNFRTSYLIMRLPLGAGTQHGSDTGAPRLLEIAQRLNICGEAPVFAKTDRFVVFDPNAPARTVFVLDDLRTAAALFFGTDAPAGSATMIPRAQVYDAQWPLNGNAFTTVVRLAPPPWLAETPPASGTLAYLPADGSPEVILEFSVPFAEPLASSNPQFFHRRLLLPFVYPAGGTRSERAALVASMVTGFGVSGNMPIRYVNRVAFNSLRAMSLSAIVPPGTEDCGELKGPVHLIANSPYATFGDEPSYTLKVDLGFPGFQSYVSSHCPDLGLEPADLATPANGPKPPHQWLQHIEGKTLSSKDMQQSNVRRLIRLADARQRAVTIPETVETITAHDRAPGRPLLKFVLGPGNDATVSYVQDFPVTVGDFKAVQDDAVAAFVGSYLENEHYFDRCYYRVFRELLTPGGAVAPPALKDPPEREGMVWVYLAKRISEFMAANSPRAEWDSLAAGRIGRECHPDDEDKDKWTELLTPIKSDFTETMLSDLRRFASDPEFDTRPMPLLTQKHARLVGAKILGLEADQATGLSEVFAFENRNWRLTSLSADVFRNVLARTEDYQYLARTNEKTTDFARPDLVSFAFDSGANGFSVMDPSLESDTLRSQFGMYAIRRGVAINLDGTDGTEWSFADVVQEKLEARDWKVFGARLMLDPVETQAQDEVTTNAAK